MQWSDRILLLLCAIFPKLLLAADAPALDVLKAGLKTLEATADCIADAFDVALAARRSE